MEKLFLKHDHYLARLFISKKRKDMPFFLRSRRITRFQIRKILRVKASLIFDIIEVFRFSIPHIEKKNLVKFIQSLFLLKNNVINDVLTQKQSSFYRLVFNFNITRFSNLRLNRKTEFCELLKNSNIILNQPKISGVKIFHVNN